LRTIIRTGEVLAAAAGLFAVGASPALAHYCYKTDSSANNGTNGQAWSTVEEWIDVVDAIVKDTAECAAPKAAVIADLQALPENTRVMGPGFLAGGSLKSGNTPPHIGFTNVELVPESCLAF
jgi:hypothetical protein